MCNIVIAECPERPLVNHREGNTVYYTKITKAEKDYLKKCKQAMKK